MLETLPRTAPDQDQVPTHPLLLPPVAGAIGGALLGGLVLWSFLADLRPVPWWPETRWQMALMCGSIGGLLGFMAGWHNWQTWQARKRFAGRRSLTYSKAIDDSICDRLQITLNRTGRVSLVNAIFGPVDDGVKVLAGDMIHTRSSTNEGDSRIRRHVFCFEVEELALPQFTLQPEGMFLNLVTGLVGLEDIDFVEHPQFSRAYHLSGISPPAVRQLFQPELIEFFREHRRWEVRGEKGVMALVYCRPVSSSAEFERLYSEALEILTLFRRARARIDTWEPPVRSTPSARPAGPLGGFLEMGRTPAAEVHEYFRQSPPRSVPAKFAGQRMAGRTFICLLGLFIIVFGLFVVGIGISILFSAEPQVEPLFIGGFVVAAGALVIAASRWWGNSYSSLLRDGRHTTGKVDSVERTNLSVNNQVRYRARIRFDCFGTPQTATLHLYGEAAHGAITAAHDQREIQLLFDPDDARRVLVDLELISDPALRV